MLTDSGGYQIFSLPGDRTINERGARFAATSTSRCTCCRPSAPSRCRRPSASDIMMVLDVCVDVPLRRGHHPAAMERTHRWALRSLAARTDSPQALFAIVQGGVVPELRKAVGGLPHAAPLRRLRHRRPRGRRHALAARGHHPPRRGAAPPRPAALPDGRRHAARPALAMLGGRRHVRLHPPDAARVAGHGVHLDGPREAHPRTNAQADVRLDATCTVRRPAPPSAARTCTTCSSAMSRWGRGSSRCTTCITTRR
jgi:hypothetical protein